MKKYVLAAMFIALGVAVSPFHFMIGAAKVFPMQHLFNVLLAVILGTRYNVLTAFGISSLRNIYGMGTLLAFPGSMIGALLAGMIYKKTQNLLLTALAEVFGTGILGALVSYPIATLLLGKEVAVWAFILPFTLSSLTGAVIAYSILLVVMKQPFLSKYIQS